MNKLEKVRWPSDAELRNTITIREVFYVLTQDINAAIFLSQLYYWTSKSKKLEKWVYKTIKELQKEIYLTGYQQRRARQRLLKLGLIEEKLMGMPRRIHFRLRFDFASEAKNQGAHELEVNKVNCNSEETHEQGVNKVNGNSEETSFYEMKKLDPYDKQTPFHSIIDKITTKITTETTTEKNAGEGVSALVDATPVEQPDSIIFSHWKIVMDHPHAKMDKKRHKLIKDALGFGYTVKQICDAISGCAVTPHNIGLNDKGQRFDGLHIILRDADQIDRFIANFLTPPRNKTKKEQSAQSSFEAADRWAQRTGKGNSYE